MILNRILMFRQFFGANCFCKSVKINCFSTVSKTGNKKIKEIKDFVINKNKFESHESDLKKPVLLYSNEKSSFYRKLFILNVCQGFFWIYLANVGITIQLKRHRKSEAQNKEIAIEEETTLFTKLNSVTQSFKKFIEDTKLLWKESRNQVLLSIGLLICGQLSICLFTLFTIRSVRYIILSPGARNVRITTFSMSGSPNRYRNYDISLENVSAFQYRNSGGSYIPLKVKDKWFYFLVDSNGQFYKPSLFDKTVGVFRVLK